MVEQLVGTNILKELVNWTFTNVVFEEYKCEEVIFKLKKKTPQELN